MSVVPSNEKPLEREGKTVLEDTYNAPSAPTIVDMYEKGSIDPVYQAKAHLLSCTMQQAIGMGKYQWALFVVAGFGWFADSVWPLLAGLILSPVISEFKIRAPFLSLALNIGLLVGTVFWSFGCDIWGRRWSFNITLFLAGVFGLAAGGAQNFPTLASLFAVCGVGAGGNMPVDAAVFLDFLPASHQYLLTVMSIWWCAGQLFASLIAWPLIANFSCNQSTATCTRSENMGWRYLMYALGGLSILLWAIRFLVFRFYESPRYLVGRGKDAEAIAILQKVATFNGRTCSLTVEDLQKAAQGVAGTEVPSGLLNKGSKYNLAHVKALFATKKLAWTSSLLIALWGIIGLASTLYNNFLPYLLSNRGAVFGDGSYYTTYRNQAIISVLGVPGAVIAGWAVELPFIGRRGTLAISAGFTGAFLFASTTARTSNALLGWNCGYAFNSNIMYGVLYAISSELFPAKDRGTGNGITSMSAKLFSVMSPIIALYADLSTAVPVYVSGGLLLLAGGLALLLPFEPRGKASL